ncbi:hypothetical protein R5R35_000201 [Gryllus longicercus]|uniref:Uncharacterized protein n=1 Tax=Gryllus longicercus TaxID=2509291 RepID=A0AAN9ZFA9_9ORTH
MHQGALLGAARRKAAAAAAARRSQYGGGPAAAAAAAALAAAGGAPRGKVTARCLWNACKALTVGLLLMMVGCAMATIGYYAEQLSVGQEVRGNATVPVKNESRTFHLNNLSYAGPIVMGVGGRWRPLRVCWCCS